MEGKGGPTVAQLFTFAFEQLQQVRSSELNSADASYQESVKQAMGGFLRCAGADVYSENEPLEEFSAQRLRFVLAPAYLAELALLVTGGSRTQNLTMAKKWSKDFLNVCEKLGLVSEKDLKTLQRNVKRIDDATRREEKFERAKRQIENKKKLKLLQQKLEENRKNRVDEDVGIDEETFRECVLLEIQVEIKNAIEGLDSIEQELPLAQRMEDMKKLEQAKGDRWKDKEKEQPKPEPKPITVNLPPGYSQTVGPQGQITIKREDLQAGVFRPGYNMATMSIEEAGEIDYREAVARQKRENEHKAQKEEEPDEDSTVHYDTVLVYKEREWDAFKDDNPTGSGNTTGNLG